MTIQLYDISPPICEATAVWPGDVGFSRQHQLRIVEGANIDLSSITTTLHIGAHADAPSHYSAGAKTIDQVDLHRYLGPTWVVKCHGPIHIETIKDLDFTNTPRVLFRTDSHLSWDKFNEDFDYFTPDAIEYLGKKGVVLVGIDTPSVDPFLSKDLPAHQMLFQFGMANLEGLRLQEVPPGRYELIALPLKIVGADGSPVRAILRDL